MMFFLLSLVSKNNGCLTYESANMELQCALALAAPSNTHFRVERQAGLVIPTVAAPWVYSGCYTYVAAPLFTPA